MGVRENPEDQRVAKNKSKKSKKMNGLVKTLLVLGIIALVFMGGCSYVSNKYNSMVNKQENVTKVWADVQSAYQRRADLIPNLVNIVKGAANFEQSTLTAVIEARAKATAVTIKPEKMNAENMTPENQQKFIAAQEGLSSTLSRLMVVIEKYPELKANQNFTNLQVQLEGTENRINVERRKYNEAAQDYNMYIKRFPNNFLTGLGNFEPKPYFEADKGAEKAPEIKF